MADIVQEALIARDNRIRRETLTSVAEGIVLSINSNPEMTDETSRVLLAIVDALRETARQF